MININALSLTVHVKKTRWWDRFRKPVDTSKLIKIASVDVGVYIDVYGRAYTAPLRITLTKGVAQ